MQQVFRTKQQNGDPATLTFNLIQNYWDFGLRPSSGIVKTRKHNVSDTRSVCVLR
jgi:hypothetical protein